MGTKNTTSVWIARDANGLANFFFEEPVYDKDIGKWKGMVRFSLREDTFDGLHPSELYRWDLSLVARPYGQPRKATLFEPERSAI